MLRSLPVVAVAVCVCLASCATEEPLRPRPDRSPVVATTAAAAKETTLTGTSVEGRPITATIFGSGPDTVLMLGCIHGNEPVGEGLMARFADDLRMNRAWLEGRRVIIVPVTNPDGLAHRNRHNSHGVDLNRNFPATNFAASFEHGPKPLSEPESQFLASLIQQFPPARVVSIHAPLACVNYDGPAASLANRMAELCALPVKASIGHPTPGSLGSWLGVDRAVPIITLEDEPGYDIRSSWSRFERALIAAVDGN